MMIAILLMRGVRGRYDILQLRLVLWWWGGLNSGSSHLCRDFRSRRAACSTRCGTRAWTQCTTTGCNSFRRHRRSTRASTARWRISWPTRATCARATAPPRRRRATTPWGAPPTRAATTPTPRPWRSWARAASPTHRSRRRRPARAGPRAAASRRAPCRTWPGFPQASCPPAACPTRAMGTRRGSSRRSPPRPRRTSARTRSTRATSRCTARRWTRPSFWTPESSTRVVDRTRWGMSTRATWTRCSTTRPSRRPTGSANARRSPISWCCPLGTRFSKSNGPRIRTLPWARRGCKMAPAEWRCGPSSLGFRCRNHYTGFLLFFLRITALCSYDRPIFPHLRWPPRWFMVQPLPFFWWIMWSLWGAWSELTLQTQAKVFLFLFSFLKTFLLFPFFFSTTSSCSCGSWNAELVAVSEKVKTRSFCTEWLGICFVFEHLWG